MPILDFDWLKLLEAGLGGWVHLSYAGRHQQEVYIEMNITDEWRPDALFTNMD